MSTPAAIQSSSERTAVARLGAVDIVRGIVMILMALDHTRDFFHVSAMTFSPEDLSRSWPALFFTRWITHLCAPAFMLLAGLSAWLWQSRGRTPGELSRFLWQRGLWLILLDLVVMRLAMFFSLTSGPVILSALWALGWSMVILAGLVQLPLRLVAILSIATIVLHNLADPVRSASWVWQILHQPGIFAVQDALVLVAYPLVPWFAVMACSYCLGPLLACDPGVRARTFLRIGFALAALFFILRLLNAYGDPRPWSAVAYPVLSFLNTAKYPPSLDFLLMTLAPVFVLLGALDHVRLSRTHPLTVFGRVPLFFYVVHFFLIHVLAFPLAWFRYGAVAFLWQPLPSLGGSAALYPAGYGYPLWAVYVLWGAVVVLMYPICLYVSWLKERRRARWLSFI